MIQEIRKAIANDNILEAFSVFKSKCQNTKFLNQLVILESRYRHLKESKNKGIVYFHEASVQRNQIINSLIELSEEFDGEPNIEELDLTPKQREIKLEFNNNDIHKLRSHVAILRSQGKLMDAGNLLANSLQEFLENLGPFHATVSNCQQDLGIVYIDLGIKTGDKEYFVSAKNLFRSSLDIFQIYYGHVYTPKLPNFYNNLGTAFYHLNHHEEARRLFAMAYEISIKTNGADHFYSYMAKESIIHIDQEQNQS